MDLPFSSASALYLKLASMAPAPKDPWAEQPKPQSVSLGRGTWSGTPIPAKPAPPKPTQTEFLSLGRGIGGVAGVPSAGFNPSVGDFPGLGRGTGVQGVGIGRGVPLNHGYSAGIIR